MASRCIGHSRGRATTRARGKSGSRARRGRGNSSSFATSYWVSDEQPLGGQASNLDRDLVPVLKGSANIATVPPSDNAGLGVARAVSVVSVLLQNSSLAKYKLLPLSGAQLINTGETLATSGVPANIRERRRIEIRLRKSTPHDVAITALPTTRITDAKPQRPKPAPSPPPVRQAPASPWSIFPVR